jgi:adenylate cyclase
MASGYSTDVADYSRAETAVRAGVELEYVDRLVELGILTPAEGDRFTAGDARRAGTIRNLENAGIPLDGLADALRRGSLSLAFMDSPVYERRFAPYTGETFGQLSGRTGLPVELLMLIREAMGSAQARPDDLVREDELVIVPYVQIQLDAGVRPIAIERLLRVLGDSYRRMAEAEADWWRTEVSDPRIAAGESPEAVADSEFSERLTALADETMQAIWHGQQAHAWTGNIIGGFESLLAREGLYSRIERVPAMCFLDITGYTRLTQERGDAAAADLATQLSRLVERTSMAHAGRAVKWLGDGVMFYFREPGLGVEAALQMVDGVAEAGLPPAHVGLHAGPVIFQEGDYYGQTVNVASRIAEYARPGEVLVSRAVVDASGAAAAVAFREIGPVELKGVAGAMELYGAHRPSG